MRTDELITYDAIPDAVWEKLLRAADDPVQSLRLMAVATVTLEGKPSNRTLVLRGVDRSLGVVWFHTDRRSPKMRHLKERPYLSALGYEEDDRVQIRLDGEATLHENDALAEQHWEQASMAVRRAYGLAHGPGEALELPDPRFQVMHSQQKSGHSDRGRHNFVVIQMRVEVIDWLQVGSTGQIRAILRADKNWKAEPVVP
jgi:pyridoxamine 5'-phosphate oxidase